MISSGNRILDVLIVSIIIFIICEFIQWIVIKYFAKKSIKAIGGSNEEFKDNSENKPS